MRKPAFAGTGDGDGIEIPYYYRSLDFEKQTAYTLSVRVTDGVALQVQQTSP